MSEYGRRILAFSVIAIALGIGISLGIAVLPINEGNSTSNTTTMSTTQSSTVASSSSALSVITSVVTTEFTTSTTTYTTIPTSSTTELSSETTTGTGGTTTVVSTVTSAISTTTATVSSVSSATSNANSTCGSGCGSFSIIAVSLNVGNGSNTLDLTLQAQGDAYVGSATVYINNTIIGTPPASENQPPGNIVLNIQPNQSSTIVLVIPPSTLSVQSGSNYFVLVYGWIGVPGEPADTGLQQATEVTAT